MAPPTNKRGGRYATTYDYNAASLGIHKPYLPAENRIVKALVEAALESGISSPDAVRLAIGVYKEIDVLARDERGNILSRTALKDIRVYCRAIMRSGTTFSSFEIASRAVAAWRLTAEELAKLHGEWNRESVNKRLKARQKRQELAAKRKLTQPTIPVTGTDTGSDSDAPPDQLPDDLLGLSDFDTMQELDRKVDGGDPRDDLDIGW